MHLVSMVNVNEEVPDSIPSLLVGVIRQRRKAASLAISGVLTFKLAGGGSLNPTPRVF